MYMVELQRMLNLDLNLGPECFLEISREPCQLNFCVVYQVKKFILLFYIIPTCQLP